jgi:hypothetical protein
MDFRIPNYIFLIKKTVWHFLVHMFATWTKPPSKIAVVEKTKIFISSGSTDN